MKKYAADNLIFLREHYSEIYKLVRNKTFDRQRFLREEAKNGQPIFSVQTAAGALTSFYSRYNPALETDKWVESLENEVSNADNILVFGFGLGYHIAALIQAYPDKVFYIYEPEVEMLLAAIESADLRPVLASKQIAIFGLGDEEAVMNSLLVGIFKSMKGKFAFTVIPAYRRLYPELLNQFSELIGKAARGYQININTISHYRTEWVENLLVNMDRNLRTASFRGMYNSCQGLPAIIVGSGPSLTSEIEKVRMLKDRSLIIAAGSSIQGLLHHGIEPHLVVSMDAGEPNRRVFAKLDVSEIPFLYIPMIKHTAIRDDKSPYLMHAFFEIDHLSNYLMELTNDDAILASTASVTGTAIQAAVLLGCNEITFIGQDLSYPNDLVYAEGVAHSSAKGMQKRVQESDVMLANTAGGMNRSNLSLLNIKNDIEDVIKVLPHISFYNGSPIGAEIENAPFKPLDDLISHHAQLDLQDTWFKKLLADKTSPYPISRIEAIVSKINKTYEEIVDFNQQFEELEEILEEASQLDHKSRKATERWFEKFELQWSKLIGNPVYACVYSFFLLREQTHAERFWSEMRDEQDLYRKLSKLRECIVLLVEGMRRMNPILLQNFEKLQEKLIESDVVDPKLMIEQRG